MQRKPDWIRVPLRTEGVVARVNKAVRGLHLTTVCEDAKCPNRHECWEKGTATLMILGHTCTRSCAFCAVEDGNPTALDELEPQRAAAAAAMLNLRHVVLTSVTRDDLPDEGSGIWAATIREMRKQIPGVTVEVLIPDFNGRADLLETVLEARPDVLSHNLETVRRLQAEIRPQASYGRSLQVLHRARNHPTRPVVKSGLMLGLGETTDEVREAIGHLHEAGCELLTLGQYLPPTHRHRTVSRWAHPDEFEALRTYALDLGFRAVASGPLVRSSYKADELFADALRTARAG